MDTIRILAAVLGVGAFLLGGLMAFKTEVEAGQALIIGGATSSRAS